MNQKIVCLILFIGGVIRLGAVPASPDPVEIIQPDGQKITCFVRGDEHFSWIESPDGYTLLYNKDKFLVYAEQDKQGNLAPSKYIYRDVSVLSPDFKQFLSKISKELRYSQEQIKTLYKIKRLSEKTIQKAPVLGEKKALCVLMGFKDRAFTKPVEEFEALMNQEGYYVGKVQGSVRDYYKENSYGKMDLTVTIVGPYQADSACVYYASEDKYQAFALEAVRAADPDVDFNEFTNENGRLDVFHILFAGYGDEQVKDGKQIWAHKWELKAPVYLDGVQIYDYSCSPELRGRSGANITSIGPICHELCHVFGADDYYDTNGSYSGGNFSGTGNWDLMANGNWNFDGDRPAHINMFQKILFGWVEPIELTTGTTITDMPNSAENPAAYIVKPSTDNEMYVLENRQRVGFDANIPGNGLLIYHIHNLAAQGRISNMGHPQQAYVVSAATTSAAYTIPNDNRNSYGAINSSRTPFSNSINRDEFSGTSIPAMFRWIGTSGEVVTDKPITEIAQENGLVSFKFMGGEVEYDTVVVVTNLTADTLDRKVILAWEAQEMEDSYTYAVYRNGELLQTGIFETVYEDSLSTSGDYEYCVVASFESPEETAEDSVVTVIEPVCTAITYTLSAISEIKSGAVRIYPNPVSDWLHFESRSALTRIQIVDLSGHIVYDRNLFHASSAGVSTALWDKGIYVVKVVESDGISVYKVAKE